MPCVTEIQEKDDKEIVGCFGTSFMLSTVENDMVLLAQPVPVLFYGNVHMFQNALVSVSTASTINPQQTTPREFLSRHQTA